MQHVFFILPKSIKENIMSARLSISHYTWLAKSPSPTSFVKNASSHHPRIQQCANSSKALRDLTPALVKKLSLAAEHHLKRPYFNFTEIFLIRVTLLVQYLFFSPHVEMWVFSFFLSLYRSFPLAHVSAPLSSSRWPGPWSRLELRHRCSILGVHWISTPNFRHYLFADSSRLIWKRERSREAYWMEKKVLDAVA